MLTPIVTALVFGNCLACAWAFPYAAVLGALQPLSREKSQTFSDAMRVSRLWRIKHCKRGGDTCVAVREEQIRSLKCKREFAAGIIRTSATNEDPRITISWAKPGRARRRREPKSLISMVGAVGATFHLTIIAGYA